MMRKRVLFSLTGIGAITLFFIVLGYSLNIADGFKPSNAPKSDHDVRTNPSKMAFLLNKGGIGSEQPKFNMNYGLWLTSDENIQGGFETLSGEEYFVKSQSSYNDGRWHNTVLTFDEKTHILKLYMDGLEVASKSTNIDVKPDSTGNQPIRLGANSLSEKGKITGNYTGQLDDIQIWNIAFTNDQVLELFQKESQLDRSQGAWNFTIDPVVRNSQIIEFSGINYADVVNSRDINLDSYTISLWFNTNMNVTENI